MSNIFRFIQQFQEQVVISEKEVTVEVRINPSTKKLELRIYTPTRDGFVNASWEPVLSQEALWAKVSNAHCDTPADKLIDDYTRLEEEIKRLGIKLPYSLPAITPKKKSKPTPNLLN